VTQLAGVGLKTIVDNGRERKTDGLWKHLGIVDAGQFRASGYVAPLSGAGVEIGWYAPTSLGYVQSFNRDLNSYADLTLQGKNLNLFAQGPTGTINIAANTLTMTNGLITTPMLAANAVQQAIGNFFNAPTTASATLSTWVPSAISVGPIACSGAPIRIEVATAAWHTAPNWTILLGVSVDGSVVMPSRQIAASASINMPVPVAWVDYYTPSAGMHTFTVVFYNMTTGTANCGHTYAYSTMWLTEQKR